MHIGRTENINANARPQDLKAGDYARPAGTKAWSVDTDTAGYVRKAMSLDAVDSASKIADAKVALAAGVIDSPDASSQAAAALLAFGV